MIWIVSTRILAGTRREWHDVSLCCLHYLLRMQSIEANWPVLWSERRNNRHDTAESNDFFQMQQALKTLSSISLSPAGS